MKTPKFLKKYLGVFFVCCALSSSQGCSTLINGRSQEITIQNNKDSNCILHNTNLEPIDIKKQSTIKLQINRSKEPIIFSCDNSEVQYKSKITKEGYFSIAFIDFGAVDYFTGSLWEYDSFITLE